MLIATLLLAVLLVSTLLALVVWALFAALLWLAERLDRSKEVPDPLDWLDDVKP